MKSSIINETYFELPILVFARRTPETVKSMRNNFTESIKVFCLNLWSYIREMWKWKIN